MCLAVPLQIVAWEDAGGDLVIVERQEGEAVRRERVNMMLLGAQPVGTWILASLGLAQEVIDDAQRALIEDALAALSAALDGNYDPDRHFADLSSASR
jgi:hydrogenase expression/formation protein HypC